MTRKTHAVESEPQLRPFPAFYSSQLARYIHPSHVQGCFLWAPRGLGVHQAVAEHVSSDPAWGAWDVRVIPLNDPRRADEGAARTSTGELKREELVRWVVLQVDGDFEALRRLNGPLGRALREGRAIVTAELPPNLVEGPSTLQGRDLDPIRWSDFWVSGKWVRQDLNPWDPDDVDATIEWARESSHQLVSDAWKAETVPLYPEAVGGHPVVLHEAWRQVLAQRWTSARELSKGVTAFARRSSALEALYRPVHELVAANDALASSRPSRAQEGALRILRRLSMAPACRQARWGISPAEEGGLTLLIQLGLARVDKDGDVVLTCPLFGERLGALLELDHAPPPSKAPTTAVVVQDAGGGSGTLQLRDERHTWTVALKGRKQLELARVLVETLKTQRPASLNDLAHAVETTPHAAEQQIARLRRAIGDAGFRGREKRILQRSDEGFRFVLGPTSQ